MAEKDKIKETLKKDLSDNSDVKKIQNSELAELQENVNTAREKVNTLIREKLSLDSTLQELIDSGAQENQIKPVREEIELAMEKINMASIELSNAVILSENVIEQAKTERKKGNY